MGHVDAKSVSQFIDMSYTTPQIVYFVVFADYAMS